jgi:5'-3' exonuclease
MVLVDFSHLSARNLYVAISQAKPRKKNGKYITEDFIPFYYHLMLNSLRHITSKFKKYGEIILCLDDRNYWRKDIYPDYKGSRSKKRKESDINFEEFYEKMDELIKALDDCFPYKVLKVPRAEADDLIGVLSMEYGFKEDTVVITSDKDMKQVLEYGVKLYDPIKTQFVEMTPEELKEWKMIHVLCGDDGDDIPHVKKQTQFTDTFISYLKNNNIFVTDPYEFEKLSISKKLYEDFDVKKKNRKGEELEEKDIFKSTPFGPAGAKKALKDIKDFLKNPLLKKHFKRNCKLVLFDLIPEDLQKEIKQTLREKELKYDPNCIMEFIMENKLQQQMLNITEFYIQGELHKEQHASRVYEKEDEWI